MKHRFVILIALTSCLFLDGCSIISIGDGSNDPLGFTDRAQIRANAQVQIAQSNERARIAEAQSQVDKEIAKQSGETSRNATSWMFVPILMIISILGVAVWMKIYFASQANLEFLRYQYTLGLPAPSNQQMIETTQKVVDLPGPHFSQADFAYLRREAERRGGIVVWVGNRPMVEDQLTGERKLLTMS